MEQEIQSNSSEHQDSHAKRLLDLILPPEPEEQSTRVSESMQAAVALWGLVLQTLSKYRHRVGTNNKIASPNGAESRLFMEVVSEEDGSTIELCIESSHTEDDEPSYAKVSLTEVGPDDTTTRFADFCLEDEVVNCYVTPMLGSHIAYNQQFAGENSTQAGIGSFNNPRAVLVGPYEIEQLAQLIEGASVYPDY